MFHLSVVGVCWLIRRQDEYLFTGFSKKRSGQRCCFYIVEASFVMSNIWNMISCALLLFTRIFFNLIARIFTIFCSCFVQYSYLPNFCRNNSPYYHPLFHFFSCQIIPPPLMYPIPWTTRLSSSDTSVVVVVIFVLIYLCQHLCHCRKFLGPVVNTLPPPSLSLIPQTCCIFLVLFWRLRGRLWFRRPVLLYQHCRCCCRQYPDPVNTLAPPPSETFTWTCCIFCFLNWRLHCRCRDLGIIFLCQRLRHGFQFIRPVISTQQLPLLWQISNPLDTLYIPFPPPQCSVPDTLQVFIY